MLLDGNRIYWGRKEERGIKGIVVCYTWISTKEDHLNSYSELYGSAGWNSLIIRSEFLNFFFPDKATSQAFRVVGELTKEVKARRLPIVFAVFSGGAKSCMYKVLQIIEGKCKEQPNLDEYQLVRDCICGHIYDSSPVDFTSYVGTQFFFHPSVLRISQPPRLVSWMAKAITSGLNTLFLNRFEVEQAEYWQSLYSSVTMGSILILCSEEDDLAPYQLICSFAERLKELGGDVKLVKWASSPHVGHFKQHQFEYETLVFMLLERATSVYCNRIQMLDHMSMEVKSHQISEVCNIHNAVGKSREQYPGDSVLAPGLLVFHDGRDMGPEQADRKPELAHSHILPSISAHSVLGRILFDVCVPKNIDDWDIKPGALPNRVQSAGPSCNMKPFNSVRCLWRSRL